MATTTAAAEVVSFDRTARRARVPARPARAGDHRRRHRGPRACSSRAGGGPRSVQPLAKTHSCEAPHFQYHVSGVLRVRMDDGREFDCRAGDVSLFASGHDAWTVGDEPAVVVDFQGMLDYARAM